MTRAPLKLLVGPVMLLAVAALIVNVVVSVAWTAPRWSAQRGIVGGAQSVETARQRVAPALRFARDTYGRLGGATDDLESFRSHLVTTMGGAELLGLLDGAGDDVGIDLDDTTLQYVALNELGVVQLGITFPVIGTYEAVRHLLDELAVLPMFLVIDGVGLQSFGPSAGPPAPGASQEVRVDLGVSVFLNDPEVAVVTAPGALTSARRPLVSETDIAALRRAADSDDPEEIADAMIANLAALPVLPVDPESLVVRLDKLDTTTAPTDPRRNLFSVVLPPSPDPIFAEDAPEDYVAPEPVLPVRLLGILLVEGRRRASLTDEDRVYVVEAGDRLPNGVEIAEVGTDFVAVIFENERTVLTLEGTRP